MSDSNEAHVDPAHVRRRSFLLGTAITGAAAVLAACGGGDSGEADKSASPAPTEDGGTKTDTGDKTGSGDKGGTSGDDGTGKSLGTGSVENTSTTKGSVTTPLKAPAELNEAPMLASLVKAGKLPELAKRLPDEPYVTPHNWVKKGNYGGGLRMLINNTSTDGAVGEWFYDYSPLRFLNDGRSIGPGLVTKWTSNADGSQWEFTLRKGVKWSDGKPVTTADVLFWWKDMVNYDPYTPEGVPDECKSGKGTICKLTAKDDHTWVMKFDAPAPLTADRLAMWTNGYGGNGPVWIVPSHFVKQFHPRYNKKVPKNWASTGGLWERSASYRRNPKCPTLAPFRLSNYNEGKSLSWERNPYCYTVNKDGDQLPYIDEIVMTQVQDQQVGKLKIQHGEVDISHAAFNGLVLSDVSTLNNAAKNSGIKVQFWDSGTGAAGIFFLNQDYYDPDYRAVFEKPEFRQALSLAFDRAGAKRAVYFQQGEQTTGTMSPKAMEFLINAEGKKMYKAWRDSYVKYDPKKAKQLLDKIGVVDADGDGWRELPNGKKMVIRIDYPADASDEYKNVDARKVRDWKEIGVNARQNPVPPTSFGDEWQAGKYMGHSVWEVGDGPNCLLYPQWMVPIEPSRWAPLQGEMYNSRGTKAYTSEKNVDPWKRKPPRRMPPKGSPVLQMWKLYDKTKVEPDVMKRTRLVWDIQKIHIKSGPYFQGTVANPPQPIVTKEGLMNVPTKDELYLGGFVNPWIHPSPAVYGPENFFWDDPSKHTI